MRQLAEQAQADAVAHPGAISPSPLRWRSAVWSLPQRPHQRRPWWWQQGRSRSAVPTARRFHTTWKRLSDGKGPSAACAPARDRPPILTGRPEGHRSEGFVKHRPCQPDCVLHRARKNVATHEHLQQGCVGENIIRAFSYPNDLRVELASVRSSAKSRSVSLRENGDSRSASTRLATGRFRRNAVCPSLVIRTA